LHLFINSFSYTEYITALVSLITIFVSLLILHHITIQNRAKEYIGRNYLNEETMKAYENRIQENLPDIKNSLYKQYLSIILNSLNKFFGELKFFSLKTFDKHLQITYVYSFLFFYLSWLFGGSANIGTIELLPSENKFLVTLALLFEIILFYFPLF